MGVLYTLRQTFKSRIIIQSAIILLMSLCAVYEKIIDRVQLDKNRSVAVTARCLKLLKSSLLKYVPSKATLSKLEQFCQYLIAENPANNKVCVAVNDTYRDGPTNCSCTDHSVYQSMDHQDA